MNSFNKTKWHTRATHNQYTPQGQRTLNMWITYIQVCTSSHVVTDLYTLAAALFTTSALYGPCSIRQSIPIFNTVADVMYTMSYHWLELQWQLQHFLCGTIRDQIVNTLSCSDHVHVTWQSQHSTCICYTTSCTHHDHYLVHHLLYPFINANVSSGRWSSISRQTVWVDI